MSNELSNESSLDEQAVSRAITDPTTTPFTTMDIQELEKLSFLTTPRDCPLFEMLSPKAVKTGNRMYEWVEATLGSDFSGAKYDGYTVSMTETGATYASKYNYLMAVRQIARVGGLVESLASVDGNALQAEMRDKYVQLIRSIEYYLWNGTYATASDETNGVVTEVTTAVSNGSVALAETTLQTAIVSAINNGIIPDTVFCSPTVAQRIANFGSTRVQYVNNNVENGIGQNAFFYATPFGYTIRVQPVRTTFLPTGKAYVLDTSLITMRYSGDTVLASKRLAEANDGNAVLLKSYFGLQIKNKASHIVITNITEALS